MLPQEAVARRPDGRAEIVTAAEIMHNQGVATGALALALRGGAAGALLFGPPPKDIDEIALLTSAMESPRQGDLARLALGWRYLAGRGVAKDCHKAVGEFYLPAAMSSLRIASAANSLLSNVSFPYAEEIWLWDDWLQGWSRARQSAEDVLAIRSRADADQPVAELALAELLLYGDNPHVDADQKAALEYYKKASEHGSARAAHNLALILQQKGEAKSIPAKQAMSGRSQKSCSLSCGSG
jgi:TPR repeat protein